MTVTKYYAGLENGKRRAFLLGPYNSKDHADLNVARAYNAAIDQDAYLWFANPGVWALNLPKGKKFPEGRLNSKIGRIPAERLWLT